MSERALVVCGSHGETPATFTCRHLARGVACGYHASADDPTDSWPDAWCDLCEDAFQAEGGVWNAASEQVADIKLLCARCYEAARDRNRTVPPLAKGAGSRLTDAETAALVGAAVHAMQSAQAESDRRWQWRAMARWDFDRDAGTLAFSDPERSPIIADVRLVGSYSTRSSTFQWAWETLDADDAAASPAARVRVFGEVRGIAPLTTPSWACDETTAWEMAAVAGYVLGAEALYRAPIDHLRWFMLLSNWR